MTDRTNVLTVVLDKDYRVDDVQTVIKAIEMFTHVVSVTPNVANISDHVNKMRLRREITEKLLSTLTENT